MTERPILFSSPMVRAILEGRKTQTRRVVTPQPEYETASQGVRWYRWRGTGMTDTGGIQKCLPPNSPYGQPGDRLWVRETLRTHRYFGFPLGAFPQIREYDNQRVWSYAADEVPDHTGTKVSIHMPRWASRITLEITGVRVERLQEISKDDAEAEGCFALGDCECTARAQYQLLWDQINAKRAPWASNPWVWVIEFKRLQ